MSRVGIFTHAGPVLTAPYFAESLAGLDAVFGASVERLLNPKDSAVLDGVLWLGVRPSGFFSGVNKVVVVNGRSPGLPFVDSDNEVSAVEAVRHLIRGGHRRIAVINGKMETDNGRDRHRGYRRALVEAGIVPEPRWEIDGRFDGESGRAAARKWLVEGVLPTAIFAANDAMALGAMEVLQAAGKRVPEDVAIVGFDDAPEAALSTPPLTTVRQPFRAMAAKAAEMLLAMLDGGPPPESVLMQAPLVVRGSCGLNKKG